MEKNHSDAIQMPGNRSLAMAYIIPQSKITQVYQSVYALKQGTLFPELDKPFSGKKGGIVNG